MIPVVIDKQKRIADKLPSFLPIFLISIILIDSLGKTMVTMVITISTRIRILKKILQFSLENIEDSFNILVGVLIGILAIFI